MYNYCFFCLTQRAEIIRQLIERRYGYRVISPRIVQRHWEHGQETEKEYRYLPGYLFVYTDERIENFAVFRQIDGVIRQLGELESGFRLNGTDLAFAELLLQSDGVIGPQRVYQEGDRIQLCEGLLTGMSGRITKVDRQYKRMQITFMFDGLERKVWTGYDVVAKLENEESSGTDNLDQNKYLVKDISKETVKGL